MIKLLRYMKYFNGPVVMVVIFTFIRTLSDLMLPTLMSDIIDTGVVGGDTSYILRIGGIMLGIALFGGACSIYSRYLSAKVGMGFGRMLRTKLFTKITKYSLHEIDETGTASLITRTTNDIVQVQHVVTMLLRMAIMAPLMAIGGIVMALRKDVPLSGIILIVILIMGVVIGLVASRAVPLFKSMQKKIDRLNLVVRERLTGIRVIRAFNRKETEEKRFDDANLDLTNTAIRVNKLMAVMQPFLMLMFSLMAVAIVWFGARRVDMGAMEVGDMMAFIQYGMLIMFSVLMLTMIFVMVPRASASAIRINEILELDCEIRNPDHPVPAKDIKGTVEFKNVSFYYHNEHGASEPAVKDISFTSGPGEMTAIIGGTGSGKSTLINLIPRFYDVTSGEIRVNGVDIRDMDMADLRKRIGLVPQQALLFSGTVSENISFGKQDASMDEIVKAAEAAQAAEFIDEMKDGYESVISQGGTNVSGGQKQRLSIARALVKQPEIYLFDDSFSALDYKTESKLRQNLNESTGEATVLVVAQKVTSVMNADRILVLDQGKMVGVGTHKELMASSEVYREIAASQLSKEELANG